MKRSTWLLLNDKGEATNAGSERSITATRDQLNAYAEKHELPGRYSAVAVEYEWTEGA